MLKEIPDLDKVIENGFKFADWCWEHFDKPGNEKDFDLDESLNELKNYPVLIANGVENVTWSTNKDCGGRHYTTLLIRFGSVSPMAILLLEMDMQNKLIPVNPATDNSGSGAMEFVANVDGDDMFVCPFDLQYSDGWLTLEVKVFRV